MTLLYIVPWIMQSDVKVSKSNYVMTYFMLCYTMFCHDMYKSGFLREPNTDIERQMTAADDNLLRAVVLNDRHILRHLFPSEKRRIYDLRPRAHNFTLPLKDNNNFIARFLFRI